MSTCSAVAVLSPEVEEQNGFSFWETVLVGSLLLNVVLVAVLFLGSECSRSSLRSLEVAPVKTKVGRTVATQSQTTYAMHRAQARFVPLQDYAQGAWVM